VFLKRMHILPDGVRILKGYIYMCSEGEPMYFSERNLHVLVGGIYCHSLAAVIRGRI